jgi:hypothetical protein
VTPGKIFVAMPSYRDRELSATLLDLFGKAKWKSRLRVVVAWQFGQGETLTNEVWRLKNLEILPLPADQSLGPNWARRILQDRFDGEEFTLLLDGMPWRSKCSPD